MELISRMLDFGHKDEASDQIQGLPLEPLIS